ncbi:MAG: O-antigen ligase family protein [Candidatus Gracilibacteria bacterium]|jgi:hypothetical protein
MGNKLFRIFFYGFVASLPFQIKTLFFTEGFYGTGFFNPYLSHFLYVGDIFLVLSLLFFGLHIMTSGSEKRKRFAGGNMFLTLILGLFLVLCALSLLPSVNKLNSLLTLFRYFEFFVVYILVSGGFVKVKNVVYVFLGAMVVSTFIGIFQYVFQQSLGLSLLGEPVVSSTTLGVAKVALLGRAVLRAYATFPHPNIFAGYLVFAIFFTIYYWKEYKVLFTLLLVIFGAGLLLTFSRSAILALLAGMVVYYSISKIKISWRYLSLFALVFVIFVVFFDLTSIISQRFIIGDANSLYERGVLYSAGKNMFFDNFFGVGLGNFTEVMQNYIGDKLMPWQFQPVHNIFVLVLNEVGIFGFIVFAFLFVYLAYSLLVKSSALFLALLFGIFIIGLFDHYFVSLYQGQALFWLFLGMSRSLEFDVSETKVARKGHLLYNKILLKKQT